MILLGGKVDNNPVPVDGFDVWETISAGKPSPRTEILLNIDLAPKKKRYRGDYDGAAIRVAGGKVDNNPVPVDGFDVWETISTGKPSPRTEILLNIDLAPKEKRYRGMESIDPYYQGAAIRVADMKLLVSCPNSTWFKPPELYNKEVVSN